MEKYHTYFLSIHIAAGTISLVLAPIAMIVKKGGSAHRLWGKIYFWSMAVVALTAIIMSVYHHIPFLLMVAIFSFYSAFAGYRILYRKKAVHWKELKILDKAGTVLNGLFSAALCVYGMLVWKSGETALGIISLVFAGIGMRTAFLEFRSYFRPVHDLKGWLRAHIGGMVGSYIAAVTAFLVNTGFFLPDLVRWLGPTVIGVPLIVWFTRKYVGPKKQQA
ncbi:MAG: hypothetical protein FD123_2173 [Bacteroidetes bacterium]|nr:MAG: hypothetical protein FD123_2173 [Bacteroidota bacterium]